MAEEEPDEGRVDPPAEEVVCEEGAPEWVVTFGDMMSLLLTFFILLLSFAEMEMVKYKHAAHSLKEAFGVQTAVKVFNRPSTVSPAASYFSMEFNSQSLKNGLKAEAKRHSSRSASGLVNIQVYEDYRGIVVEVDEGAMFQRNRADLRPAIWPFLDGILEQALTYRAQITVEAHTDGMPKSGGPYVDDDALSAARAISVIRYFFGTDSDKRLRPERFEAVPMGSTRPKVSNQTESGRRRNRRVELIFHRAPDDFRKK